MAVLGTLAAFVPLLIIGGIIAVVVAAVHRNEQDPKDPGIGTVRRVFFYGLAFVALMLATSGVTLLLSQILDSIFGHAVLRNDSFRIAFGLAATIVGTPIWLLLWRAAGHSLEQYPAERGSLGRKFYTYLVLSVSAGVVAAFLVQLLEGIFSPSQFNLDVVSPVIVWSGLWWLHWTWEEAEGQPSPTALSVRRLYVYVTATYGLILLAVGVGQVLGELLNEAYNALFGGAVIGPIGPAVWDVPLRDSLSLALIGAIWWWWHWHRIASGDTDSALRQVVIYLVAIFGGLVISVGAAATVLFAVLAWAFDPQAATPLVAHFQVVPGALAVAVIGVALWRYHSEVVLGETARSGERLISARRAYRYLTAAVGLGTLAVGLATLVGLFIGLIIPGARGSLTGGRFWAGPLAVALTLMIVGTPLWWRYWSMEQSAALAGTPGERQSLSRRIFIFVVFGASVLATLAALSTFLLLVLQPLFQGTLSVKVLDGGKWALGALFTAAAISVYYWQVLREDREAAAAEEAPAPAARPKIQVTALAPAAASATIDALAARLGLPITLWQRQDAEPAPDLTAAQLDAAAEAVRSSLTGMALVVIDAAGVRVVPFAPGP